MPLALLILRQEVGCFRCLPTAITMSQFAFPLQTESRLDPQHPSIVGGKQIEQRFGSTNQKFSFVIELQQIDRSLTDESARNCAISFPLEMINPAISPRVKQSDGIGLTGHLHNDAIGLMKIATRTCPCQVVQY